MDKQTLMHIVRAFAPKPLILEIEKVESLEYELMFRKRALKSTVSNLNLDDKTEKAPHFP